MEKGLGFLLGGVFVGAFAYGLIKKSESLDSFDVKMGEWIKNKTTMLKESFWEGYYGTQEE